MPGPVEDLPRSRTHSACNPGLNTEHKTHVFLAHKCLTRQCNVLAMHNRDIARRGPTANLLNHDTQFHKQRDTTGHSMWLLNPHALARTITLRILD